MPHKSANPKGKLAFLAYYQQLFPTLNLESFLTHKHPPVLLISPTHQPQLQSQWAAAGLSWQPLSWFPSAIQWPSPVPLGTPLPGYDQGRLYPLNPASLLPVLALQPESTHTLLDACAAPGGKTLAIHVLAPSATLYANDASTPRFQRLRTLIRNFDALDIQTRNFPAQTLTRLGVQFDRILLDAPCSSEKHVYQDPGELETWSPKRIHALAHQQYRLLEKLFPLLTPHGHLVYSTCALTPEENEAVVARVLQRLPLQLEPLPPNLPLASPGLIGFGLSESDCSRVLRVNENSLGFDPMFVALLSRQN